MRVGMGAVMAPLLLICAWCGVTIRQGSGPVSHGCCRECADKILKQMEARDGNPRP